MVKRRITPMKNIKKRDITDEGNCQDRLKGDEVERQVEINAATDPNWTRKRAQWERAMDKQPGVREGHVVEYSGGCESGSY
jgi:hypothetical protein